MRELLPRPDQDDGCQAAQADKPGPIANHSPGPATARRSRSRAVRLLVICGLSLVAVRGRRYYRDALELARPRSRHRRARAEQHGAGSRRPDRSRIPGGRAHSRRLAGAPARARGCVSRRLRAADVGLRRPPHAQGPGQRLAAYRLDHADQRPGQAVQFFPLLALAEYRCHGS